MEDYKYCPMCADPLEWDFIEDRDRQICRKCGWINFRNPLPVINCLVLNGKGELLLIKRGVEPCKGHWALPGGFIEVNETLPEAAARELKEETGLEGSPGRLVGIHMQETPLYGTTLTIGMEFEADNENDLAPGYDAEAAKFFPREGLPEISLISNQKLIEQYFRLMC